MTVKEYIILVVLYFLFGYLFLPDQICATAGYILGAFAFPIALRLIVNGIAKLVGRDPVFEQKERNERRSAEPETEETPEEAEQPVALPPAPPVRVRSLNEVLDDVDHMDGIEFESWCADLLERLGYENVETTVATGDQGVDIIAERKGMKYAIQCKRYNTLLGNSPIQEVYAGMRYYDCRVAVVMTNSRFTKAAWELAEATGVKLWDRYMLKKFLRRLEKMA